MMTLQQSRPQSMNLQSPEDVQLVGVPNVQLVGWATTPALDKGLIIGGGAGFIIASALGLAGNRMGAKVMFGVSAGVGVLLLAMAAKKLNDEPPIDAGAVSTDVIGGAAIATGVLTALYIMHRGD